MDCQPIDTAPRDQIVILCEAPAPSAYYDTKRGEWIGSNPRETMLLNTWGKPRFWFPRPTVAKK